MFKSFIFDVGNVIIELLCLKVLSLMLVMLLLSYCV